MIDVIEEMNAGANSRFPWQPPIEVTGTAIFSDDDRYRYALTRRWSDAWVMTFVGLNPSTATATGDDPTIRRCMGFARREAAGGILMLNLYAFRSTDPRGLLNIADPFGEGNEAAHLNAFEKTKRAGQPIVCAWGVHGILLGGDSQFIERAGRAGARLCCLGKTMNGHPKHPLYLRGDTLFEAFP